MTSLWEAGDPSPISRAPPGDTLQEGVGTRMPFLLLPSSTQEALGVLPENLTNWASGSMRDLKTCWRGQE